jgi:trigger factor
VAGQPDRAAGRAYGLDFEQFLQITGQSAEDLVGQLTEQARETVKAQLVLDAVGREAGIEVGQEDLEGEINRQAARLGRPAKELAEFMTAPERIGALVADAFRRKTIDHLLEKVQVLSPPPPEEDDEAAELDDDGGAAAAVDGQDEE